MLTTDSRIEERKSIKTTMEIEKLNLRILPAFVMDKVLGGAFLVGWIRKLRFQDFGFVEQLMVKAEDPLILCIY